jgi:hypothetical protein
MFLCPLLTVGRGKFEVSSRYPIYNTSLDDDDDGIIYPYVIIWLTIPSNPSLIGEENRRSRDPFSSFISTATTTLLGWNESVRVFVSRQMIELETDSFSPCSVVGSVVVQLESRGHVTLKTPYFSSRFPLFI